MKVLPALVVAMCLVACESGDPERAGPAPDHAGRVVAAWYRQPGHGGPVRWDGMSVIDLDTGDVEDRKLPEYGAGDAQFKLVRVGDRLVFRGSRGRRYGTFSVDPGLEERAEFLGWSWYFVPSAVAGRVWLTSFDDRPRESGGMLRAVREVDLGGTVTAGTQAPPPNKWVVGAVGEGLLFQGKDHLRVWDPETGRDVARIPGVFPVAQSGDTVASCVDRCPALLITDVAAGTTRRIQPPAGWDVVSIYDGSFAPDRATLAIALARGREHRLGLVDVPSGDTTIVSNSRLDPDFGVSTWSASGDWVVFYSGAGTITAYGLASGDVRSFELGEDHVVMALARGD